MRTSDRGSASPDRSAVQAPSADRRRVFSAHDESAARAADCAADQTNRDDGCSPAAAATPVECPQAPAPALRRRSEEHTSELQSLMRISYAVFCLKKKHKNDTNVRIYDAQTKTH